MIVVSISNEVFAEWYLQVVKNDFLFFQKKITGNWLFNKEFKFLKIADYV